MRGRWALAAWLVTTWGCTEDDTFQCVADDQCNPDGRCEANQFCSFPDTVCESGRRFGDKAATGIAGQCVPLESGSTGVAGSSSVGSASSGSASVGSASSGEATGTSSGPAESSSTMGFGSSTTMDGSTTGSSTTAGGSSSSTGEEPRECENSARTCSECLECTTPMGAECGEWSVECEATPDCMTVYQCLSTCAVSGLCLEDCCDGVDAAAALVAAEMMDCQIAACEPSPACESFVSYPCSGVTG